MTDALMPLLLVWGPALLGLVTFLSCIALPLPASLLMGAAGAFAASGDLSLVAATGAALAGAIAGDTAGYLLGRSGAGLFGRSAGLLAQARDLTVRRGLVSVFLSRWLFAPLGPYVNLVAGAAAMPLGQFLAAVVAGEAIWVGLYVGAGYAFADRIETLSALAGNLSGALAAGAVALGLGLALWRAARHDSHAP